MTMPVINTYALVERWQYIRDHPKEWDQRMWVKQRIVRLPVLGWRLPWSCGTACCFAGGVAIAAGGVPIIDGWEAALVRMPDGQTEAIRIVAMRVLGLNDRQAGDLFWAHNSLDVLANYIQEWTGVDPRTADLAALTSVVTS